MAQTYPHLLSPLKRGKFILKNRMQSSNSLPHFSQGPEEYPADATIAHFLGRARTGAAFVTFAGMDDNYASAPMPNELDVSHFPDFDIHNPKCQNYLVEMIEAMHYMGSLVSGSIFSANKHYRYINEDGVEELVDASPASMKDVGGATAMMNPDIYDNDITKETLLKVIKSIGQRAGFYKRLGFDAVTIHMSYRAQLPGQLLSPLTNHRTDEFGVGSMENRARFTLMMLQEIRKAVGDDMLVEIQFSAEEVPGGYTFEEGIQFLRMFEPYVDIVQVRSPEGDENHPIPFELNPTPFLDLAARVKAEGFQFLVSSVGGYFDPAVTDKAIAEGKLDLVAMARAWISNPNYGELLYEDRADDIVPCLRCNKCHGRGKNDLFTTTCSVNPKFGFEVVDRYLSIPVSKIKNIAIIGGGPGGMRTAMYLADRGHKVTLFEAEGQLGGAICHADYIPFKWTLKDYKDYLIYQVGKRDIKVVLNTRVTPDMVANRYDAVIAAVGAEPIIPKIPGVDGENVTVATDAIMHADKIGDKVVVIGGGEVGVETGMFFAQMGKEVTVVEMRDELAADTTIMHYRDMFEDAWERIPTFHYILNAVAKEITPDHVTYTDKDGVDHELPAQSVILSVGMCAKAEEALAFYGAGDCFYMVGDCCKPGTIQTTNRSAYVTAVRI